ncbi:F0F1 ATP synthase subunit B [Clostridium tyrobutyricum]|uniref:ATP synthase subunit b n=1 Tax=Clostridium tyrobutyricum DIVETGP TaxID=1408889 RepID=W6N4W8_CLOTY|nr:F0F1 ATP synthase subunit B [Clostridium tyrobutyricum]AND83419.1 ATP synthase subunit B [Clostridium tyrobutyricum]ANP68218.1 ATP synthase F0 subunit B [Clostridium tyrobutyricum]MBV4416267.1 F0F1 ATP synthase subunit B [Clostridium tyrobutyricum]MBV4433270.1 F0F1 ATP synthase subunit B [Clostridium tyrobutyricum]QNB67436.1 F0F1 ATP synthase subunit B [Clostridium tyrobutyricum]
MEIDWTRVIITIINFIILFLILKHFFFKRVGDTIDKRQEEINSEIKNANENEKKSEELLVKHQKLVANSKQEGKSIVEDYKNKADKVSKGIVDDAQKDAQLILNRAKTEAEREKQKAEDDIKNQVVDLAVLVSSKALESSIDEAQHRKLIKDFIAKVGI